MQDHQPPMNSVTYVTSSTENNCPSPYVWVELNEQRIKLRFVTGYSNNMISSSLADRLGLKVKGLLNKTCSYQERKDSPNVIGWVSCLLNVECQGLSFPFEALVVSELQYNL